MARVGQAWRPVTPRVQQAQHHKLHLFRGDGRIGELPKFSRNKWGEGNGGRSISN